MDDDFVIISEEECKNNIRDAWEQLPFEIQFEDFKKLVENRKNRDYSLVDIYNFLMNIWIYSSYISYTYAAFKYRRYISIAASILLRL
jgi:hypothetical protein